MKSACDAHTRFESKSQTHDLIALNDPDSTQLMGPLMAARETILELRNHPIVAAASAQTATIAPRTLGNTVARRAQVVAMSTALSTVMIPDPTVAANSPMVRPNAAVRSMRRFSNLFHRANVATHRNGYANTASSI